MSPVAQLGSLIGDSFVEEATQDDRIEGVQPRLVVSPGTIEEVSAVMAMASREGWRVAPRGRGTKLGIGSPPSGLDLVLDLSRLDRLIEHAAGDLVMSAEAGITLRDLQAQLRTAGQMLALDLPDDSGSLGGIIATNPSGPRRFRYGTIRDLIIGVTVVLPDGTIAKAGGKVVKNVAGYDLSKLMTGSLGTLAVIVKAVFRLHPVPPAQRLVEARFGSAEALSPAVQRLLHSSLVPTAIQLSWPGGGEGRVGILFEGVESSVVAQSAAAVELLGADLSPSVHEGAELSSRWDEFKGPAREAGDVLVKVTCQPARLSDVVETLRRAVSSRGATPWLNGMLGSGVLYLGFGGVDGETVAGILDEVRASVQPGHATVLNAPLEVKQRIDVWGPVGNALPLMRRVKDQFDPGHILNPGRFVGGI